MDFIINLPESTACRYNSILVIVDRLMKMAIYLPCRKDLDSPELACLFFEQIICHYGIPEHIITDCGSTFTSLFWKRVCSHMVVDHCLSTLFHPQTDGQTECQNQTMEQYLCAYVNYEQDNWADLLPLAQFAYNNTMHATTWILPFYALYSVHPHMHLTLFTTLTPSQTYSEQLADNYASRINKLREQLRKNILEAQEQQTKYAGGKDVTFNVGDKVWLSTWNIKTTRASKKLDYKQIGPYLITKVINKNAYRLALPPTLRIHNVFHVSLLDAYQPPVTGQLPAEPMPVISSNNLEAEEWEVERILDSHTCGRERS